VSDDPAFQPLRTDGQDVAIVCMSSVECLKVAAVLSHLARPDIEGEFQPPGFQLELKVPVQSDRRDR